MLAETGKWGIDADVSVRRSRAVRLHYCNTAGWVP